MKTSDFSVPRTDLAAENRGKEDEFCEYTLCGLKVTDITVGKSGSNARTPGRYVTVSCPLMRFLDYGDADAISEAVSRIIRDMCRDITKKEIGYGFGALVAGIGNRFITSDAIGPKTADKITVTAHLAGRYNVAKSLGCAKVSAIHPGVKGQTGIETVDVIKGAAQAVKPDVVLVVDALAARSVERLAATVQITDSGISPGSGIGKGRNAVNRKNTGYPVISVGVPTVVDSATLVFDALNKAGIEKISDEFCESLYNGAFYVSPGDGDVITDEVSTVLAAAIDKAFYTEGIQTAGEEYT